MDNFKDIKYFEPHEFDSPDQIGSGLKMQRSTLLKLDKARELADMPFFITSGYRTRIHNERVGGVNGSSHEKGFAVDVSAHSSIQKFKIVKCALEAGFTRIGISKSFVHLDDDPIKVPNVIWTY